MQIRLRSSEQNPSSALVGFCEEHLPTDWPQQSLNLPRVMLVGSGSMRITTASAIHIVPAGQAAWIPAGMPFQLSAVSRVRVWTVDLSEPDGHPLAVFRAPPLMREMAMTTCAWRVATPPGAPVAAFSAAFNGMLPIWRQEVLPVDIPMANSAAMERALVYLLKRLERPVGLADAAAAAEMSQRTLQRRCREELGTSLSSWLTRARVLRSLELLSCPDENRSVANIALACGYNSPAAFTRAFSQHMNTTPSAWRTASLVAAPSTSEAAASD